MLIAKHSNKTLISSMKKKGIKGRMPANRYHPVLYNPTSFNKSV